MTSKITPAQLDEIKAAAKKATPGPWRIDAFDELRGGDGAVLIWGDCTGCAVFDGPDGEHIATMDPATTLALVAEVRELRATIERARVQAQQVLNKHSDGSYGIGAADQAYLTIKALGEEA